MRERDFWEATVDEITRFLSAYNTRRRQDWQMQASLLYALGDLVGISAGRFIVGKKLKYPALSSAFPALFDEDDDRERNSVNNFLRFAAAHNAKVQNNGRNIKS